MKKKRFLIILLMICISIITINCITNSSKNNCIGDFNAYAYEFIRIFHTEYKGPYEIYPNWKLEKLFNIPNNGFEVFKVEFIRNHNGRKEVWVSKSLDDGTQFFTEMLIFYPDTNEIKEISGQVEDSNIYVNKLLYLPEINTIIGINSWSLDLVFESNENDRAYILSEFDEKQSSFIFETNSSEAFLFQNSSYWRYFLIGEQDMIWYIEPNIKALQNYIQEDVIENTNYGNLYRFNPLTKELNLEKELIDVSYIDIIFGNDQNIYIIQNDQKYTGDIYQRNESLLKYSINDNNLYLIDNIPNDWISINSFLMDSRGDFWFDTIGKYSQKENSWELLHPKLDELKNSLYRNGGYLWNNTPKILFESSNGYLWFSEYSLDGNSHGLAWLNPEMNDGCWFTTYDGIPKEGPDQIIWLMIGNRLYSYDLKDE